MISAAFAILETDEQRNELAEFYKKYQNRFYMVAYSKLHNSESSYDAVQETFLRIASDQKKFFELCEKERVAFATVIVRNVSVDMYKEANRIDTMELTDNIAYNDSENPIEEELLYKFTKNKLIEFLCGLSERQRDILYLKAVHGMTIREIAEKLSMTENAVRQRLFCTRQAIKEALQKGDI